MVKLSIDRAIVTKAYLYEKTGQTFLTITDGTNELNMGAGDLDPKAIPLLVPIKFDAELKATLFGHNQSLTLTKLVAVPL